MHSKLVLVIAPGLEEELVDLLLEHPAVDGFTSCPVEGNGKQHNMSLAEQVAGRRKRLRFELIVETAQLAALLEALRIRLAPDTVYWVEAVDRFGKLGTLQSPP